MRWTGRLAVVLFGVALFFRVPAQMAGHARELRTRKSFDFRLTNLSLSYDFTLHVDGHVPESFDQSDGYREGPGYVTVFRKGESKPLQTISLPHVVFTLESNGKPLTNSAQLYDDQGVINVDDFNFDGNDDFAIQTGNEGSYGSPSYSVFLYSPSTRTFRRSQPLSELIQDSLGFFQVDKRRKRLITFSKSGCCHHITSEYRVVNSHPQLVEEITEDETESGVIHVTHERIVNGKRRVTEKDVPAPAEPNN